MPGHEKIYDWALHITQAASKIALGYFDKGLSVELKKDASPVTQADRETELFLRKKIEEEFPDHGILGEEFGTKEARGDYQWILDPIDGTQSFIRGLPFFGTLAGVLYKNEPVVGVAVMPVLGEVYSACRGQGAYLNGTPIWASQVSKIEQAFISHGEYKVFAEKGKTQALTQLLLQAKGVRAYTDCYGHLLVARGALDAMIDPQVSVWDVAALAPIVEESRARYYALSGEKNIQEGSFISLSQALRFEDLGF